MATKTTPGRHHEHPDRPGGHGVHVPDRPAVVGTQYAWAELYNNEAKKSDFQTKAAPTQTPR